MSRNLVAFSLIAVLAGWASAPTAAAAPTSQAATRLVSLVKLAEREAQAIRFMLAFSPMKMPKDLADCTVGKATPQFEGYFATLFDTHLSEPELQQAIAFYETKDGQAAVAFRLRHEQSLFDAAAQGTQITNEQIEYPPDIRSALDVFGATPAGKLLAGDELVGQERVRTEVSDLRSTAMSECLVGSASEIGTSSGGAKAP